MDFGKMKLAHLQLQAMLLDEEIFQFRPQKMARMDEQQQDFAVDGPLQVPAPETPTPEPYNLATLPSRPEAAQNEQSTFHQQLQQYQQQSNQQIQQNIQQQTTQQQLQEQTTQNFLYQQNYDQRQVTINVESPRYQSYGHDETFGPVPPTPRHRRTTSAPCTPPSSARGRPSTPSREQRPAE